MRRRRTMDPNTVADLHAHTDASDGLCPPMVLVRRAKQAGLQVIAVTDHDTVAGIPEARAEAEIVGVQVVPGIELCAYDGEAEVHIVGLYLDPESATLLQLIHRLADARNERIRRIAAALQDVGVAVTAEEIFAEAGAAAPGRPHVANVLRRHSLPARLGNAWKLLGHGGAAYVPKLYLSTADAIAAVHEAGGVASLAHPGVSGVDDIIPRLAHEGLDAIEAHYPVHGKPLTDYYGGLARRYEMVVSGGSDYHARPGDHLGAAGIDAGALQKLQARRTVGA
jgi:predicted metal-dependent phosphoesterase TrpH